MNRKKLTFYVFLITTSVLIFFVQPNIFLSAAYAGACVFAFLITYWYRDIDFSVGASLVFWFLGGALSILLSLATYRLLEPLYDDPFMSFLNETAALAGPVEESMKLVSVLIVNMFVRSIYDSKSGLYYSMLVGLGFSMIENLAYFERADRIIYLRFKPGHIVYAAIWGVKLGEWIERRTFENFIKMLMYLSFGAVLHGISNFLFMQSSESSIAFALSTILYASVYIIGLVFLKRELSKPEEHKFPHVELLGRKLCDLLRKGQYEEAKLLLQSENYIDVNTMDMYGNTPLHYAVMHGFEDIVEKLLERGAKIYAFNLEGKTPLDLAMEKDNDRILEMLKGEEVENPEAKNELGESEEGSSDDSQTFNPLGIFFLLLINLIVPGTFQIYLRNFGMAFVFFALVGVSFVSSLTSLWWLTVAMSTMHAIVSIVRSRRSSN